MLLSSMWLTVGGTWLVWVLFRPFYLGYSYSGVRNRLDNLFIITAARKAFELFVKSTPMQLNNKLRTRFSLSNKESREQRPSKKKLRSTKLSKPSSLFRPISVH